MKKSKVFTITDNQVLVAQGQKDMLVSKMSWFTALVPINQILTDMAYQREISEARVNKLKREYNSDRVDVKCVNYRPDEDKFACMDGLHTLTLLKAKGITHMNCKVFVGKTYEEEAIFFAAQNKGIKKITSVEEFNALLEGCDPSAVMIDTIMKKHGIKRDKTVGVKRIRSIRKLCQIYNKIGADGLDFTFQILVDAGWGDDPKAYTEAGLNVGFYAYPECLKSNRKRAKTKYSFLLKILRKYKTSTQYTDKAAMLFSETVTRHPQDAVKKLIQRDMEEINETLARYAMTQKIKEYIEEDDD